MKKILLLLLRLANAIYLKTDGISWRPFVVDAENEIYSATGSANGICPATGDSSYTVGLTQGNYCVQLKIQDGGANDTDGAINGEIADPRAVVGQPIQVRPPPHQQAVAAVQCLGT